MMRREEKLCEEGGRVRKKPRATRSAKGIGANFFGKRKESEKHKGLEKRRKMTSLPSKRSRR